MAAGGSAATPTPRFDLLVRGGTVVAATGRRSADVGIVGERIAAVETGIGAEAAAHVVDADGLLVLPGVIDVHTHTRIATDEEPDRFFQDSVAAAFGGTTTFLSFNNPGTGLSPNGQRFLTAGIDEWIARTWSDAAVDIGLSAVVTAQHHGAEADIRAAIERGVPTFKCFMVYDMALDERHLRSLLAATADAGALLQIHCEDRALLDSGIDEQVMAGRTQPRYHADSRPPRVEAAGTVRAITTAAEVGAPMYAVHVSCAEAVDPIARARARGQPVLGETCPHYLTLDASRYDASDEDACRWVISPPLRAPGQPEAMWRALADGSLDVVATDHVPDRLGREKRWAGQPFTEISNGAPGIETLLSLVYSEGVAKGRITLERLVDVLATTPARLFGLPTKGAIEVGRDADLVLFDPSAQRTIRAADLHHTSDYTPYEGLAVSGGVHHVIVRGKDVIREGRFVGQRGNGRYVERRLAG